MSESPAERAAELVQPALALLQDALDKQLAAHPETAPQQWVDETAQRLLDIRAGGHSPVRIVRGQSRYHAAAGHLEIVCSVPLPAEYVHIVIDPDPRSAPE